MYPVCGHFIANDEYESHLRTEKLKGKSVVMKPKKPEQVTTDYYDDDDDDSAYYDDPNDQDIDAFDAAGECGD